MVLFSERYNITPKKAFQIEELNEETRNQIFSQVHHCYTHYRTVEPEFSLKFKNLYVDFFKKPSNDSIMRPSWRTQQFDFIKEYVQESEWYYVFNLIEYIFNIEDDDGDVKDCLKFRLNKLFLEERVAYKIVNWEITQITDDIEVESIEEAMDKSPEVVKKHLEKSLRFLSDKTNPDYKNSVKESISAVESVCKLILDNKNATLGQALNEIEKNTDIEIPTALKNSFSKLYGYTSSEDGVRHASFDDKDLDYDLAKLLLVSCSAFTNYLLAKSDL